MDALETMLFTERTRLVHLCAYLTGDRDVAEDLAQETLIEAWRQQHKLTNRQGYKQWISAIARNICLRWLRQQHREQTQVVGFNHIGQIAESGVENEIADDFDLELELERDELAMLLDRALGLLPVETRSVLIQKYIEDSPHAEIAARLGLSEGGVAMRLQRGKLAFRRIVTNHLRDELLAYGLGDVVGDGWQPTRIWCPVCGQHRLNGRFVKDRTKGQFQLQGPSYCSAHGININITCANFASFTELLGNIKGFKPALSRFMKWTHNYYRNGLAKQLAPCIKCGQLTPLQVGPLEDIPPLLQAIPAVHARCERCGVTPNESLIGLTLCLPEGQQFWQRHSRIRLLPSRKVELDGRAAFLVSIESVTSSARLDVLSQHDTFEIIGIHETVRE
jgi:RNA polymerase sigma-70 factor (ECF subfamily)